MGWSLPHQEGGRPLWWPRFSSPWWVVVAGPCQSDAWRDGSQSSPRGHEGKTHRHGLLIASWVGTAPCKLLPPTFPLNFPAADGKAMVRLGSGLSTMRVLSLPVPISQIWDQRTAVYVGEAARPIPAPSLSLLPSPRTPHESLLLSPSPHPFPSLLQATWTGTTMRPSRNLGTTPSCFTWTTAAGKGGEGARPPRRRGHSRGRGMLRVLDDCGPKLLGCFGAHWTVLGPRCHPKMGFSPSFGTHSHDEMSILAPLQQCCR